MFSPNQELGNIIPSFFHIADRYCDKSWVVPNINVNFHTISLIISGEGTSCTNGKEQEISSGMLIYHYPGQTCSFTSSKTNPMHLYVVNFHLIDAHCDRSGEWSFSTVEKLPFENYTNIPNLDVLIKPYSELASIWAKSDPNYIIECRSIFMNILKELWQQAFRLNTISGNKQLIFNVCSFIKEHYNQPLTLQTLADQTSLNPIYFGYLFKRIIGITPMEYINKVRIDKSIEFLGIGYSVKQAALYSGFNDPYYFSKVFKKLKGMSPSSFINSSSIF